MAEILEKFLNPFLAVKRRNRLLPNNAEQLLFVHENIANVNYKW